MTVPFERAATWGHGFVTGLLVGILVAGLVCANVSHAEPECDRHEFTDRAGRCTMKHDAPRPSWRDEDRDCQKTRHEILLRDAIGPVRLSDDGCRVVWGLWGDPYTGEWIVGPPHGPIQIEHVVPRSYAQSGKRWTREEFERFFNDPRNLIVSGTAENQKKGSKGPSEYLPPHEAFRCTYTAIFSEVTKRYGITVKPLDRLVLAEWAERCRQ